MCSAPSAHDDPSAKPISSSAALTNDIATPVHNCTLRREGSLPQSCGPLCAATRYVKIRAGPVAMATEFFETGRITAAVLASPAKGHLLPICALIEELVNRGHNVVYYWFDLFEEDVRGIVEKAGAKFMPIPSILTDKDEARPPIKDKKKYLRNLQVGVDFLKAEWSNRRPCVVVGDFFAPIAFRAAHALGIPTVMNCPVETSVISEFMLLPRTSGAFSLGGITLFSWSWNPKTLFFQFLVPLKEFSEGARLAGTTGMVLVNSFRGLTPNCFLPSNFVLTGPLLPPPGDLMGAMAHSHPALLNWMDSAAQRSVPVVYVTTGSLVKPNQWEVETIFAGLSSSSCQVIWSLTEDAQEFLPEGYDKDRFWVESWLPQPAILAHKAIKLSISHCGWGGSVENIMAGVPIYAIPFFGDQPSNSKLLVDAGAALLLPRRLTRNLALATAGYRQGDFTAALKLGSVSSRCTPAATDSALKSPLRKPGDDSGDLNWYLLGSSKAAPASTSSWAFAGWSAKKGIAYIGTPAVMFSTRPPQPQ